jgi:hypothetical protein
MVEAKAPHDPRKTIPVDWTTVNENSETFKLSDGVKLKARLIVTGFRRSEEHQPSGEPYYSWASTSLFTVVDCPASLRGVSTQPPPPPNQICDPSNSEEIVDFESTSKQENWNVYNLIDGTVIRLRLIVQRATRTRFRDTWGEPLYCVNSQTVQRLRVAQNLIIKPKPKAAMPESGKPYG